MVTRHPQEGNPWQLAQTLLFRVCAVSDSLEQSIAKQTNDITAAVHDMQNQHCVVPLFDAVNGDVIVGRETA